MRLLLNPRERLRILTGTQLLRRRPDWLAAIWSGILSGTAMAAVALIAGVFSAGGAWLPVHRTAAVILGSATAALSTPELAILIVAALIHYALSIFYALVIADATVLMKARASALAGGAFGGALYLLNFYAFTALFPWFAHARGWPAALLHVGFGVCAALLYKRMENPVVRKPKPRGPTLRASWRAR